MTKAPSVVPAGPFRFITASTNGRDPLELGHRGGQLGQATVISPRRMDTPTSSRSCRMVAGSRARPRNHYVIASLSGTAQFGRQTSCARTAIDLIFRRDRSGGEGVSSCAPRSPSAEVRPLATCRSRRNRKRTPASLRPRRQSRYRARSRPITARTTAAFGTAASETRDLVRPSFD